jgi:hypothetical protein
LGEVPQAGNGDGHHEVREVRRIICSLLEGTVGRSAMQSIWHAGSTQLCVSWRKGSRAGGLDSMSMRYSRTYTPAFIKFLDGAVMYSTTLPKSTVRRMVRIYLRDSLGGTKLDISHSVPSAKKLSRSQQICKFL